MSCLNIPLTTSTYNNNNNSTLLTHTAVQHPPPTTTTATRLYRRLGQLLKTVLSHMYIHDRNQPVLLLSAKLKTERSISRVGPPRPPFRPRGPSLPLPPPASGIFSHLCKIFHHASPPLLLLLFQIEGECIANFSGSRKRGGCQV